MALSDLKFSSADFAGQDISSLPDKPQLTAAELKARFDNVGKVLVALGAFNNLLDALASSTGASEIGASEEGLEGENVQALISELKRVKADLESPAFTGQPTAPTPAEVAASDRIATTAYVAAAMSVAGGGDMLRAVYDSKRRDRDVFDYADTKATVSTYQAVLAADGWEGESAPYTQTVEVEGMLEEDSPIVDIVQSDLPAAAAEELKEWGYISRITAGEDSVTAVCYADRPTVDLNLQFKVVR